MFHFYFFAILLSCGAVSSNDSNELIKEDIDKQKITNIKGIESSGSVEKNYNFKESSKTYILNEKLNEISGLAYDPEGQNFIAINDEKGYYYSLSIEDFSIIQEVKFGKKGDYESVEIVGRDVFVSKSTGTLYKYSLTSEKTETFKNELNSSNDVEGLCYHKNENLLLMACKGQ